MATLKSSKRSENYSIQMSMAGSNISSANNTLLLNMKEKYVCMRI